MIELPHACSNAILNGALFALLSLKEGRGPYGDGGGGGWGGGMCVLRGRQPLGFRFPVALGSSWVIIPQLGNVFSAARESQSLILLQVLSEQLSAFMETGSQVVVFFFAPVNYSITPLCMDTV